MKILIYALLANKFANGAKCDKNNQCKEGGGGDKVYCPDQCVDSEADGENCNQDNCCKFSSPSISSFNWRAIDVGPITRDLSKVWSFFPDD